MQVEDAEEYPDPDVITMCVCTDDDNGGGKFPPGNDMPSVGDPPVISCQLLLRLLDDALNMMRYLHPHFFLGIWMLSKLIVNHSTRRTICLSSLLSATLRRSGLYGVKQAHILSLEEDVQLYH